MRRQNVRRGRETPALPSDFPSQLLAAEFELERSGCSSEAINRLIELYQTAIEFYELKGDARYRDYKIRMQRMFQRTDVQLKLCPGSQSASPQKNKAPPKLRHAVAHSPLCVIRPENLMEEHKNESLQAGHLAKKDVEEQHSALQRRLAQRKLNKSSIDTRRDISGHTDDELDKEEGSPHFSFLDEMNKEEVKQQLKSRPLPTPPVRKFAESDKSGGMSPQEGRKKEDLIAKFRTEQMMKETELRHKYESQIEEMEQENPGSALITRVIATMRQDLSRELETLRKTGEKQLQAALRAVS